jgi:hypothetical protein
MEKIKAISEHTGVSRDDLVRQAIDKMIVEKALEKGPAPKAGGWRKELLAVAGIWEDRDDIDDMIREGREQLERRHKTLFPDSG